MGRKQSVEVKLRTKDYKKLKGKKKTGNERDEREGTIFQILK